MQIFYVDETGDAALPGRDSTSGTPSRPSNYFTLAGVGIRDSSRVSLAKNLLQLKRKHFGEIANAHWGATEIKGRYLLHVALALAGKRKITAPAGWKQSAEPEAFAALTRDLGHALLAFRPLVLVNVVDKRKKTQRGVESNPIGIAYSYLERHIALTLEHQHAGEGAVIVADQQTQHETLFKRSRPRDPIRAREGPHSRPKITTSCSISPCGSTPTSVCGIAKSSS